MPRQARTISNSGIYHIMIRGINKEQIFKNETYKMKMKEIIKEIIEEVEFYVIAYCIMDNHMHLLIEAEVNALTKAMKKLNVKYAMYYNYSEKRYGHVFQDRFRSEAVEDDEYMLGVLRYIHNNPVKAKIADNILKYSWSSANDYATQNSDIINIKYLKEIFNMFKNKDEFIKFHYIEDDNLYIDTKEEKEENIQSIISKLIENHMNENQIVDQQQVTLDQKEELAKKLLSVDIISYREIAELCSLTVSRVSEIKNKIKEK